MAALPVSIIFLLLQNGAARLHNYNPKDNSGSFHYQTWLRAIHTNAPWWWDRLLPNSKHSTWPQLIVHDDRQTAILIFYFLQEQLSWSPVRRQKILFRPLPSLHFLLPIPQLVQQCWSFVLLPARMKCMQIFSAQ